MWRATSVGFRDRVTADADKRTSGCLVITYEVAVGEHKRKKIRTTPTCWRESSVFLPSSAGCTLMMTYDTVWMSLGAVASLDRP
jgi:hypothetical protein